MIKVNLKSKEIQSKSLLKSIFFLIVSLLLSANVLKAQIDIKSKIDAQTYSNYSKTIDLFEKSIKAQETKTYFLPSNDGLLKINELEYSNIFFNHNANSILKFIQNHSIDGIYSINYFNDKLLKSNTTDIINDAGNKIVFSSNSPYIMLTDMTRYESNIILTINVDSKYTIHFITGVIKY